MECLILRAKTIKTIIGIGNGKVVLNLIIHECFKLHLVPFFGTIIIMKRKYQITLEKIYSRPVNGSIKWADIESLLEALGATIEEREGSRVGVVLFGVVKVFHRPHPSPDTDKGAITSIRKWLEENGVKP